MLTILRSLGPFAAHASPVEAVRAGIGAFVGLCLTAFFVLSTAVDLELGLYLMAPFGASAVLLFAAPNSPLAQPWPAIVGNTIAALVAVFVCMLVGDPALRIALTALTDDGIEDANKYDQRSTPDNPDLARLPRRLFR